MLCSMRRCIIKFVDIFRFHRQPGDSRTSHTQKPGIEVNVEQITCACSLIEPPAQLICGRTDELSVEEPRKSSSRHLKKENLRPN